MDLIIPAEEREKCFTASRIRRAIRNKGIGLTLSRTLAEAWFTNIWSESGRKTIFILKLLPSTLKTIK